MANVKKKQAPKSKKEREPTEEELKGRLNGLKAHRETRKKHWEQQRGEMTRGRLDSLKESMSVRGKALKTCALARDSTKQAARKDHNELVTEAQTEFDHAVAEATEKRDFILKESKDALEVIYQQATRTYNEATQAPIENHKAEVAETETDYVKEIANIDEAEKADLEKVDEHIVIARQQLGLDAEEKKAKSHPKGKSKKSRKGRAA